MTPILAIAIDPWILTFSLITVAATIGMGFWSAKKSKTASDYFVAGRSVSVGWNASAISGEYLSAASFMGIAGMVMKNGYDALWYPVCYACGYLFLLLFIAGPLRRFGAYTVPDFAEGRYDSTLFRKIAVVFVLFIGFFYTMPQMKGAGTTLAYIFPGLDYRWGVILVGAVITLNVAIGGMKGITLVQAFQYWVKMFAISVPIFVLMSVYGHYGNQVGLNGVPSTTNSAATNGLVFEFTEPKVTNSVALSDSWTALTVNGWFEVPSPGVSQHVEERIESFFGKGQTSYMTSNAKLVAVLMDYARFRGRIVMAHTNLGLTRMLGAYSLNRSNWNGTISQVEVFLNKNGVVLKVDDEGTIRAMTPGMAAGWNGETFRVARKPLPSAAPKDEAWLNPFGPLTTKAVSAAKPKTNYYGETRTESIPPSLSQAVVNDAAYLVKLKSDTQRAPFAAFDGSAVPISQLLFNLAGAHFVAEKWNLGVTLKYAKEFDLQTITVPASGGGFLSAGESIPILEQILSTNGITVIRDGNTFTAFPTKDAKVENAAPRWNTSSEMRANLVDFVGQAPEPGWNRLVDGIERFVRGIFSRKTNTVYHSQFESLTNMPTNTSYRLEKISVLSTLHEYGDLAGKPVLSATNLPRHNLEINGSFQSKDALLKYLEALLLTNGVRVVAGKEAITAVATNDWEQYRTNAASISLVPLRLHSLHSDVEPRVQMFNYADLLGKKALMARDLPTNHVDFNPTYQVMMQHEAKAGMEKVLADAGVTIISASSKEVWAVPTADLARYQLPPVNEKAFSLLYTYSLIIAIVCGTAGLPHILVRFYTNPDGVAAKRTTMWVMILIGTFYLFPPVFGVLGRNLLPELYSAVGAKGTDKVVLELPSLLNAKYPGLGSVLSGITCAGAFAAFMSTFSGLLVSMTGALAHDVYGRILRPKSTAEQRLRAFKISAVMIGCVAILLGMQVEKLDINFMVGQAFAIAAASYFPLLFLSTWWRGMTMKGAAAGMLGGGLLALLGISLTSFSDLKWLKWDAVWAAHPLWRILCEQPAIWAVPLAITLMIVVSKLTRKEIPADVRMKMLVLHAPEKLGLKQEYIQEHQGH